MCAGTGHTRFINNNIVQHKNVLISSYYWYYAPYGLIRFSHLARAQKAFRSMFGHREMQMAARAPLCRFAYRSASHVSLGRHVSGGGDDGSK